MDEYLKNGNEEQLKQLLKHLEKEKQGNRKAHTDEARAFDTAVDGLIEKIGIYAMEKNTVSVEDIKTDFQMEESQAQDVVDKLKTIGVLDKPDEAGRYQVVMEKEAFERRIGRYRELTDRMRQIAAAKNTDLLDITITKKLIAEENDHAIKTRIPGLYGERAGYLWLNKEDIMEIHNGKTLLSYLDKKKDYKIYSGDNRVLYTMKGGQLYESHYDKVERTVRERYARVNAAQEKKTVRTQTRRR